MRTLILSCNTGEGHNSCAKAVKEIYDQHGEVCDIDDALRFLSRNVSSFVSGWHVRLYRHMPKLFEAGYAFAEKHDGVLQDKSPVYALMMKGCQRLYRFIEARHYDHIICTHIFAELMLTRVIHLYDLKVKTGFIGTDYTCSPNGNRSELDYYFIPDQGLTEEFVSRNASRDRIVDSGIPVRQKFYRTVPGDIAKKHFDVKPEHMHLLMMCGSMGCGPMEELTEKIYQRLPKNCELSVVCGTNQKLYRRLHRKYMSRNRIHIHSFVEDISQMMDSADLYLTKPGGISVTEACIKMLPMVFVNAVAGCEKYNQEWFVEAGAARTADSVEELTEICLDLLEDQDALEQMRENLRKKAHRNASKTIYQVMSGDYQE